jgi:hypothetical protein
MNGTEQALAMLRDIGTPQQLQEEAAGAPAGSPRPLKVNAHIHLPPNFSAFARVSEAVELAAQQQVRVLGVSNYYDYDVYGDFSRLAHRHRIFPLYGLEIIALIDPLVREGVKINDPGNPGKIYICGKGITRFAPMNETAQRLIETIRRNDARRMAEMIQRLEAAFARGGVPTGLDEAAVIDMVVRRHECPRERVYLQERHAAQAFQEAFFARVPAAERPARLATIFAAPAKAAADDPVAVQNEIRAQLMKAGKPAFVEETFISFDEAYRLILELGGIPCYPTLADGTAPICPFEATPQTLVANLRARRFHMAEFIPVRNTPDVLRQYVRAMRESGLVITAGTEHNTLDLLPIEPACANGQAVPEDVAEIFREGACVVAAHQFLMLHGRTGYVDAGGNLNPEYSDHEQRIAAFRQLGEAVIFRYLGGDSK